MATEGSLFRHSTIRSRGKNHNLDEETPVLDLVFDDAECPTAVQPPRRDCYSLGRRYAGDRAANGGAETPD
jgi:hypothetical protein